MQYFHIKAHVINGQHIREYPNALNSQGAKVRLAVKQYYPKHDSPADFQRITLIAAHGNGLLKELYEATWDELYKALQVQKVAIRSIWIADSSHQGASGVLNESILGDDPNWFDHSRDLLHLVNSFRDLMIQPIIGFAHSMGCAQLVQLSLIHPRLLSSIVLVEPVIQANSPKGPNPAMMTTFRPDLWRTTRDAEMAIRRSRVFRAWDPRVLDNYITYGLRKLPTRLYATTDGDAVTLTTTKHQEAWAFVRPYLYPIGDSEFERRIVPDLDSQHEGGYMSYRAECLITLRNLPFIRPPVFWIHAEHSPMATRELNQQKLDLTGIGLGGSGGLRAGRVQSTVVMNASHFVLFEKPGTVAQLSADWIACQALRIYNADEAFHRDHNTRKSKHNMREVSDEWLAMVKRPAEERRVRNSQAPKL